MTQNMRYQVASIGGVRTVQGSHFLFFAMHPFTRLFWRDEFCVSYKTQANFGYVFSFADIQDGRTALMHAVLNQHDIVLNRLLDHGHVNVNAQDTKVRCLLLYVFSIFATH